MTTTHVIRVPAPAELGVLGDIVSLVSLLLSHVHASVTKIEAAIAEYRPGSRFERVVS
jgi:hypothetical protein